MGNSSVLADYRELQFGPYRFALSMQERNRDSKLSLIKKKIPFTPGDYNAANSSMPGRTTEFYGTIGTGMVGTQGGQLVSNVTVPSVGSTVEVDCRAVQTLGMNIGYNQDASPPTVLNPPVQVIVAGGGKAFLGYITNNVAGGLDGTNQYFAKITVYCTSLNEGTSVSDVIHVSDGAYLGNIIQTQRDLEDERAFLGGLQALGTARLYVRPDRYICAYLEDFNFSFEDGGSFRYADFDLKFYSSDPRYYGGLNTLPEPRPVRSDNTQYPVNVQHNGSTKAFPVLTFSDAAQSPGFYMGYGGSRQIGVTFSKLNMNAGDKLIIDCDPRPEAAQNSAIYIPSGGTPTNAWFFVTPADFNNTMDYQYFLPYIEALIDYDGVSPQKIVYFQNGGSSPGSYSFDAQWYDTYI